MSPGSPVPGAVVSPLTREDRRSLALHAAIARRLLERPDATIAHARVVLQTMRTANPDAQALLNAWGTLLEGPLAAVLAVLADPSEQARELRHATPFAGILTPRERAEVYRAFARAEVSAR